MTSLVSPLFLRRPQDANQLELSNANVQEQTVCVSLDCTRCCLVSLIVYCQKQSMIVVIKHDASECLDKVYMHTSQHHIKLDLVVDGDLQIFELPLHVGLPLYFQMWTHFGNPWRPRCPTQTAPQVGSQVEPTLS